MCGRPGEPAHDIRLLLSVLWPEAALWSLSCEIEEDCVRLPKHKVTILKHRHLKVWILCGILRRALIALAEIDGFDEAVNAKVIFEGDHPQDTSRWWKNVEFHWAVFRSAVIDD